MCIRDRSAIADKTYKMHLKFYLENQRMPDATEMNDICKSLFTAVQSLAPKTCLLYTSVKTQLRRYQSYNSPNLSQSEEKDEYDIRGLLINRVSHKCRCV